MKILLAADGSEYTTKAAEYIVAHYHACADAVELHLIHVHLPIPKGLALAQTEKMLGSDSVERYYREESEAALASAESILRTHQIPFVSAYKVGNIAEEICRYAAANEMDLIVMGSHGHGAFGGLVLGSVTNRVLATTKTPVLIVR